VDARPLEPHRPDRLDSWKEIAAYLGRTEKTARRWEQHEALPIHRLMHSERGTVYAFRSEIDAWRAARTPATQPLTSRIPLASPARRAWAAAGTVLLVAAAFPAYMIWSNGLGPAGPEAGAVTGSPATALSSNPQATQAYLRGNAFSRNPGRSQVQTSIGYLLDAVRLDPEFAEAYGSRNWLAGPDRFLLVL
jgi:hypothetical protein